LDREPLLYAMGTAAGDRPFLRMLERLKWRLCQVPFHFKVVHPARFLRNFEALRTSLLRRRAMDLAAVSGTGWLGMKALGMARRLPAAPCKLAPSFANWADKVWRRSRDAYPVAGVRDAATLDALYPPSDPRFLRVRAEGGWALLLDTRMQGHEQFGGMRVGTVVDCMAPPERAGGVVCAATALLEERGVDLIVSNQSHRVWSEAFSEAGFRRGPSNCLLAFAPAFAAALGDTPEDELHFNRGDAGGSVRL